MWAFDSPLWPQNRVRFFTFFLKLNKDKTQNTFNFIIMSQMDFPLEIWFEIMNHQPITYVVISQLSKWHYVGVVDKLQHYKMASCVEVIKDNKKYYVLPNGELHGKYTIYYNSGAVMCECEYVDGKQHGKYTVYYESGKVSYERGYVYGKLHDKEVKYYASGKVHYKREYVNGKQHGKYIDYYESGVVGCECEYKDDERHGKEVSYYESGKVLYICDYVHGKLIDL